MNNKIILAVKLVVIIGGSSSILLWMSRRSARKIADKEAYVNRRFDYGKGIIVRKTTYKSHSIVIDYQIGGKNFRYAGGWDKSIPGLLEGDSIQFRYSLDSPQLIITELDNGY